MNTIQINKLMENDKYTKKIYLGTFPIDKLPVKLKYPSGFILNNQKSNEPGEHWIAIYFDKHKKCEFFDSFGNSPNYYNLQNYLKKVSKGHKTFNKKKLQSDYSSFCGYYCILFLLFKARCFSLKKFLSYFKDSHSNDILLKNLIKKFQ